MATVEVPKRRQKSISNARLRRIRDEGGSTATEPEIEALAGELLMLRSAWRLLRDVDVGRFARDVMTSALPRKPQAASTKRARR